MTTLRTVQSLLEQHLHISGGLTSRPPSYKWYNPNLQGQIPALQDVLVKTSEHIYLFITLFSLSTCIWVWKKKSQFSRKHPPPCPINPLLFPQATSTQKETANQLRIILWAAAGRGLGGQRFFLLKPSPISAKHLCFFLADEWSTATGQPGEPGNLTNTPQSQRLIPPSHHVAALRLGSSLIQGYVIPRNRRLCSRVESQQGNMLAFRKTILCEKEGIRREQCWSVFSELEAIPASSCTMTCRKEFWKLPSHRGPLCARLGDVWT